MRRKRVFGGTQPLIGNNTITASAETYGDLTYAKVDENDDGTYDYIRITDCDGSATSVDIPSEIDGLPVTEIGSCAFSQCESLKSITIPDSVTSIEWSAFWDCSSLASITIPDSVISIGSGAFELTPWLETKQAENPLVIVNSILVDGKTCSGDVEIPDSVTSIGEHAFAYCNKLTSVTIGNNVTSIDYGAFTDCSSLENITIPDSVTSIGDMAFFECSSLTSIEIPNSVISLEQSAFNSCSSLTNINVSENNKNYSSIDGVLFNKDKTEIIKYPIGKETAEYSIPNSVTSIGDEAFYYCENLINVNVPNSVTEMGNWPFRGTPFENNQKKGIKYAGKWVIGCNSDVKTAEIKEGTKGISGYSFEFRDLTSIEIPDSVTSISYEWINGCKKLVTVNVSGDNKNYCSIDGVLFNKDKTEIIKYPAGKETAGYLIPNSVKLIGKWAFKNCTGLTSIEIPDSVTSIEELAFYGCDGLTNVTIPSNVASIEDLAFAFCEHLTSITIENTECKIFNSKSTICTASDFPTHYFDGTIYGYKNSTAQAYAEKYDYKFESIGEAPVKAGDLSGDGTIDFLDLVNLSKLLLPGAKISDEQLSLADLNGNGKLDFLDLVALSKELLKNANK